MKLKKVNIFLVILGMAVFLVHIWNITDVYSIYMSEDELGYWASGAFFAGENWSDVMQYTSYYGFGYGFVLAPLFLIFKDPVLLYRAAIFMNAVFMTAVYVIILAVIKKLYKEMAPAIRGIAAFAITLSPGYVAQSSIAWSECLLIFVVWLLIWMFLNIRRDSGNIYLIGTGVLLGYSYMVHQRSLGFLLSGIMAIGILAASKKLTFKKMAVMLVSTGITLGLALLVKDMLMDQLYVRHELGNDYSALVGRADARNWLNIIKAMAGQLYYLGAATFLTLYVGLYQIVVSCVKDLKRFFKSKVSVSYKTCFYIFVFFGFCFSWGISSIFMGNGFTRIDYAVYGRYVEAYSGIVAVIGLCELISEKKSIKMQHICVVAVYIVTAVVLRNKVLSENMLDKPYQPSCAAGLYGYYKLFDGLSVYKIAVITVIIYAVFLIVLKIKQRIWPAAIICMTMVSFGLFNGKLVVYDNIIPYQKESKEMIDDLLKMKGQFTNGEIAYIDQSFGMATDYRGLIKMIFKDDPHWRIMTSDDMKEADMPDVIILGNKVVLDMPDDGEYDQISRNARIRVCAKKSISENFDVQDKVEIPVNWLYVGPMAVKENSHAISSDGSEGFVFWGPYWAMEKGKYLLHMKISVQETEEDELGYIDIVSNEGITELAKKEVLFSEADDNNDIILNINFNISQGIEDLEIRFYEKKGVKVKISDIYYERK